MRFLSYLAVIIVFSFLASSAFASEVLLPSENKGDATLPNLGITPAPQANKPANKVEAPTPVPPEKCPPKSSPLPAAALNPQPTTINITPGGSVKTTPRPTNDEIFQKALSDAGLPPLQPMAPEPIDPRLQKMIDDQQTMFKLPPVIVNDFEVTLPASYTDRLPNALNVILEPAYQWGGGEVEIIYRTLGYQPNEIPKHCQLRLDGAVVTDSSVFNDRVYSGQRAIIKYSGKITDISFLPRAVCDQPKELPQNSGGVIMRLGNKYSVALTMQATCPAPTGNNATLEIHYNGDGAADCKYK